MKTRALVFLLVFLIRLAFGQTLYEITVENTGTNATLNLAYGSARLSGGGDANNCHWSDPSSDVPEIPPGQLGVITFTPIGVDCTTPGCVSSPLQFWSWCGGWLYLGSQGCGGSYTVAINADLCQSYAPSTNADDTSDNNQPPPNPGPGPTPPPPPNCNSQCPQCSLGGMPVWWVSQPYTTLWLRDEPVGYQPAIGPRISSELAFKQRDTVAGYNTNIFSVGKKWNFSWLSYVALDSNGSNVVFFPSGGQRTFYTTNDYLTNTRLTGNTNTGFTLSYPGGYQNFYGFIVTNSSGAFQEAFLTEQINPQGQRTTLSYYGYNPANPVVRLQYVIDGDGRTNKLYYNSTSSFSTDLISQVVDAFGRTNSLSYDNAGHLTNTTDVQGISSSFTYDTNDWVSGLTTPYGTTSFSITGSTNLVNTLSGRSVLVTQPDGGHQLYLYEDLAPGIASSYPAGQVPTVPFASTFDTNLLNFRNTFYWGPRQYAALSTTNISAFTTNDFRKAYMRHWLLSDITTVSKTLSIERDPSPDSAGNTEGQKTWYDYVGKNNTNYFTGTQVLPLFVARVLPDGTTSFTRTDRNSFGAVTNEVSTYSVSGSVALRTNIYVYDPNGIDLLITTNALGVQDSSNAYNVYHEVVTNFDALGEVTTYTYDNSNRLTSTTLPSGLVTTNIYGTDDLLAQQIGIGFATNNYTYTRDLVFTHTDARGLSTTNTWDNLNRLTSTIYPDGSYVSNQYTFLDLTATKDRLVNWTHFGYDSMRRKIAETNALGNVTTYNYCACGSLESILDAGTNLTQFSYDNQGNLTNTLYPDNYSVIRNLNLLRQVVSTTDSSGYSVTNTYNNQGLLIAITNAFGLIQSTVYDALDRATNTVDASGVSITTTYDNLNRPLTRSYPDNGVEHWVYTPNVSSPTSYTNQFGNTVLYGYDPMNRKTNEVYVGVTTNRFAYDGAGDLLTLTDGKNQTTTWGYDSFGRVTNKVDAASNLIFVYQYDADSRLTNRWTPAKGNTVYSYDAVGNLTHIAYPVSPSISLAYDMLSRLTNMVDAVGTNVYSYDSVGQILSEDGPWPNDTVSYTYTNRLRTGLSLQAPNASAWTQSYDFDSARRLTSLTSPAGKFGYSYQSPIFQLPSAISLPNGAYITNTYDNVARLLSTKLIKSDSSVLDSESYAYNLAGQRIAETNTAGDYRNYTYDVIGELKTVIGKEAGGTTNRLQEQLGYAYDAAGNLNCRTNNNLLQVFNVNNLNELTSVTNGGRLTVAGTTTVPATNVTVNTSNALLYADATFASTNQPWANGSNTYTAIGWDSVGNSSTNISICYLQATNSCSYDLNGNLLSDGSRNFAYNDENELTNVWVTNAWQSVFVYDGKKRRRVEQDYSWNGSAWTETNEIRFIYDGNTVIQERDINNLSQATYTRGNDLSQTLQGAGGIGGLLARTANSQLLTSSPFAHAYYHADGNGNVTCLIYSNQMIAAKYLYDPFGNTLSMSGPLADVNRYRFSSKEWNDNAGLYYYLYRFYDPNLQRWPNHDPIGELGGINLYGFVANNPLTAVDPLGLDTSGAADSLHISSDEHNNYLEFHITCPKCKMAKNIKVDYNDAHMWGEMYDDFNNGQRSEPDYIAWMQNGLSIGGSGGKGFGGSKGQPQANCNGDPVEVDAYMRTRLVASGLQVSIWRLFYYVDPSTMQSLYSENTRVDYTCEPCSSGK